MRGRAVDQRLRGGVGKAGRRVRGGGGGDGREQPISGEDESNRSVAREGGRVGKEEGRGRGGSERRGRLPFNGRE